MDTATNKCIIFGGTFDPIHNAHVEVAKSSLELLKADSVLFIPSIVSPHKLNKPPIPYYHRVNMVRLAINSNPKMECYAKVACTIFDIVEPDYMVNTIRVLVKENPKTQFTMIMGSDQAWAFHKWKDPDKIAEMAEIVIVRRKLEAKDDVPPDWKYGKVIVTKESGISSTAIRKYLEKSDFKNSTVRVWMNPDVINYIKDNGLYEM